MTRHLAGLYQDRFKAPLEVAVAIPQDLKDISFKTAWKMLDVVEHTEATIERVLRRELTQLFGKWRRPSRRTKFVHSSATRLIRL
jgi:hypothetical protein